jgi:hypothetical protein
LLWVFAAAFAVFAAIAAIAQARSYSGPAAVATVWPLTGAAAASHLDAELASQASSGTLGLPVVRGAEVKPLARLALLEEPTSAATMRVLGLYADGGGHKAEARQLMVTAERMSKRDDYTSLWLIRDSLEARQLAPALQRLDQLLRTSGDQRGSLMILMAGLLSDPQAVGPLFAILVHNPPWQGDFWFAAVRNPRGLEGAAALRQRLASAGAPSSPERDSALLGALAENGDFAAGEMLYRTLAKGGDSSIVHDGDFRQLAALPPYDWRFPPSGGFATEIAARDGQLQVGASPGAEGAFAEQLVRLPAGRYHAVMQFAPRSGPAPASLAMEIQCAQAGELPLQAENVTGSAKQWTANFTVGPSCEWAWLRLTSERVESGFETALDRVQLTRIG